jgi:23S rRNA U2552 (ribose-2'-O)-methylase RlmE/FtsJ
MEEKWNFSPGGPPTKQLLIDIKCNDNAICELWLATPILTQTQTTKNQIDKIQPEGIWDDYKKITNPYEYIFISLSRRMSRSVTSRIPLSRSYFKMLEMLKCAELLQEIETLIERDNGLYTAHAAEGPGGFIEAIYEISPVKYSQAMTLRSTTKNIPGWRKTSQFLGKHPEITITYGEDTTGDLLKIENINHFVKQYGEPKAHIYTADGGFDFSSDFNAQEETILPLLTAEFYLGLSSIKQGGVIVVKIFDTVLRPTLELLWIVSQCFREWSIVKPHTSRGGNAERYFIGKGFLGLPSDIEAMFKEALYILSTGKKIQSFIKEKPPSQWIQNILTIQEYISKQENTIIEQTLELIKNPDTNIIRQYIEHNILRSIQWCNDFGESINKNWYDKEWYSKAVQDEIDELKEVQKPTITGWRGVIPVSEVSQIDSPEQIQQRRKHHAVTFARSPRPPTGQSIFLTKKGNTASLSTEKKV